MSEPLILISHPMIAPLQPRLEKAGYNIGRAWELDGVDRSQVRALLHAGEFVLTAEFLSSLPNLGLIAVISAGYDGVDVPWCRAHGIEVTHAAGVNADDVADHAMGLLLAGWRDMGEADRLVREGRWNLHDRLAPQPTLTGRRVGIVGLGHIGAAVARRCEPFKLAVSWWGPNPKAAPWPRAESLLALARDSDILVVAARGGADTRGLISADVIDALGPEGMLVNVARGFVVDETAMIAALKAGRLRRAALDVFEAEPTPAERWADVPGILLTPHRAGGTTEGIPNMLAQAVENTRLFLAGEPLMSPVP
ncbi:MAG: 2-hydroxyacid dehydrogenase [Alphaproteobacteria bacterium]|nr:2-hydroxyacid dehydrogenase [Alphaproteobacteria bacterium]MBU1513290.1 2-hydroxyacid dehydrogenase [Alphaproteobacteria bacterium]MBU2093590.1 2-hydroxyacid dehydrogenase [Alphaproteobacteria bacterium]MBU2151966.1 2-hydroxyacid dehydrogenase [Alphaproteobacteria bacterium]MBU2307626.1 2-hydroxyacid dehydrogenase [Alphaproteobacteria bacterium]